MHVYAYAYMYMHMHMPKLQFLKLSGEVGGFAQRPPPHRCGVVGRAARCRTIPSPPLSRKAGNSGSFWGEKLREGKKKTQKTKNNPKETGKPSDFLLLHNETLCTGGYVDGVEEKRPRKRSREMQSLR